MKRMKFWSRKLYRRVIQEISSRLYINPDLDLHRSILLAGTARSGTTWLADLIAARIPCRILFEPFNPNLVPEYSGFHYFQYIRADTDNPRFHAFAEKVFRGEIRNRWIDHQNERIFSKYRLIKEIRVNLALKWLHDAFPEVPIVFLIRHPCAVVASRMELGWATDGDIAHFLSQRRLITDYLAPHMDLIRNAKSAEEKHAVVWSVSNLIPLKQFSPGELTIVYYENLCIRPEIELPGIFRHIGQSCESSPIDDIDRPSQTARESSAVVVGAGKISHWRRKLTSSQIHNILRVVRGFGLDQLYGDSSLPLVKNAP